MRDACCVPASHFVPAEVIELHCVLTRRRALGKHSLLDANRGCGVYRAAF